jgi:hypothetical protein
MLTDVLAVDGVHFIVTRLRILVGTLVWFWRIAHIHSDHSVAVSSSSGVPRSDGLQTPASIGVVENRWKGVELPGRGCLWHAGSHVGRHRRLQFREPAYRPAVVVIFHEVQGVSSRPEAKTNDLFGFFSFTEVTARDQHHAYNEWHQLDHLPQQYSLPFVVHGQRWVSTPSCTQARRVSAPPFDRVHYVTFYVMRGDPNVVLPDFATLGQQLREADRFHQYRHSHLSGPFEITSQAVAPGVSISADVVPFRPNRGVYISLASSEADDDGEAMGPMTDLEELCRGPGVVGAWELQSNSRVVNPRWKQGQWQVIVAFLDQEPQSSAEALDQIEFLRRRGGVALAGPFESVQPWQWDWFD